MIDFSNIEIYQKNIYNVHMILICVVVIRDNDNRKILPSSHPKIALLTDIFVMLKILSSGKRGTRFRDINYMPVVKFFACLDLNQVREDSEIVSFRTETTYNQG
jgi:hypothetical protein